MSESHFRLQPKDSGVQHRGPAVYDGRSHIDLSSVQPPRERPPSHKSGIISVDHSEAYQQQQLIARASQEIHRDLQSLDINTYRQILAQKISNLEQEDNQNYLTEFEEIELKLLRAKQQEVDRLLLDKSVSVPAKTTDQQFARRQAIEEEQLEIKKETTKVHSKITKFTNELANVAIDRAKLQTWNPFHWGKIRALNERSSDIKNFLEDLRLRNDELQLRVKKNIISGKTMIERPEPEAMYREAPKVVAGKRTITREEMNSGAWN